MTTINATRARSNLFALLEQIAETRNALKGQLMEALNR